MLIPRIIPCLLLKDSYLVKTVNFSKPTYLGDPLNAIRIFNKKEVDELIVLDIDATFEKRKPNFTLIEKIASECYMPVTYGGGIHSLSDARELFHLGVEKISVCSEATQNPDFIKELSDQFGSQSIIACLDIRKKFLGKYEIQSQHGKVKLGLDPTSFAHLMQKQGAGELLINCIDRDGLMKGFDISIIKSISNSVSIPVIACGGAGNLDHCSSVISDGGASAAAAGSLFVFFGRKRAVLINYPDRDVLERIFNPPTES